MDFLSYFFKIGKEVPLLTQGQGSNLSEKVGHSLYIKPSGFRLDEVQTDADLTRVNIAELVNLLEKIERDVVKRGGLIFVSKEHEELYADTLKNMAIPHERIGFIRPSMETAFHVLFPAKYVFHFHSLAAVLMAEWFAQKDQRFLAWLREETNSMSSHQVLLDFVPYYRPGLELALALKPFVQRNILLLKNHGVLLSFNQLEDLQFWFDLENKFWQSFFPHYRALLNIEWVFERPFSFDVLTPDFAVFLSQIKAHLMVNKEGTGGFWPKANMVRKLAGSPDKMALNTRVTQEKNLLEIWWAHGILQTLMPVLTCLTKDKIIELTELPTEKHRVSKGKPEEI